jgi:hypothetical protein
MADDDAPGGSPACFLDEVDPAYAGYLTEAELGRVLAALLVRERAALALAQRLPPAHEPAVIAALAAIVAMLEGELARRPHASNEGPDGRFAPPADSTAPPAAPPDALAALEAELIEMIETTLPRIASDPLHEALNRALAAHRRQRAGHPAA